MIWIESQNKKMAAMTADTDAVGDILLEYDNHYIET